MRKTIDKKDLTTELVQECVRELSEHISDFNRRLDYLAPVALFQEKHTSGKWWNRKTYYTYWQYSEGRMRQLNVDSTDFIESIEGGK